MQQKVKEANKPLYFYHLVDNDADMSKGLISPQFMYNNKIYDLFDKSVVKYKNRILKDWNLEKYKGKDSLTRFQKKSIFPDMMKIHLCILLH